MKIRPIFLACTITLTISILIECFKYDIYVFADGRSFGLGLLVGSLFYIVYIVYAILIIVSASYTIRKVKVKKWNAFIPIGICVAYIYLFCFFPMTNLYLDFNCSIHKENRIKTIAMVEEGTISQYQINNHKYVVPFRQTSYTRTMTTQKREGVLKVLFYVYKGFGFTRVIVYVSDDSGIAENDFNFNSPEYALGFSDIKKLSSNWYSATMKN